MKVSLFLGFALFFQLCASSLLQLPNIGYMGCGFDSRIGQPVMESVLYPVVSLTFKQNHYATFNNTKYLIPDQVAVVVDPSADSTSYVEVYTSSSELETSLSAQLSAGFKVPYIRGMFSASAQASAFSVESNNQGRYTGFTNLRVKSWKSSIVGNWIPDSTFSSHIKGLPEAFNPSTCPQYSGFIAHYGTHYISQALYGGSVSMSSSFSYSTYASRTQTGVSLDLSTQFYLLTFSGSLSASQQTQLSQLNAEYSSKISLVGGDPSDYLPSEWTAWAETVPSNPIFVSMDLIPLPTLVSDKTKQKALEMAISAYLGQGQGNIWQKSTQYPIAVYSSCTGVINNIIYVAGGTIPGNTDTSSVRSFNPSTNQWVSVTSLPYSTAVAASAVIGEIMYVFGGISGGETLSFTQEYQASIGTWNSRAAMMTPRYWSSASVVNGLVYVIGGQNSAGTVTSTNEAYNPSSNSWTSRAPMRNARTALVTAAVGGKIYAIGGSLPNGVATAAVEMYDPSSNFWTSKTSMPKAVWGSTVGVVGEFIYVIGGTNGVDQNSVQIYDPTSDSWSYGTSAPVEIQQAAGATIGGNIYVIGGSSNQVILSNNFAYDTPASVYQWC